MRFQLLMGLMAAFIVQGCVAETDRLVLKPVSFCGMCDASAAVALTEDLFAVANNQDSVLRIYRKDGSGMPVRTFDLTGFLKVKSKSSQSDLEGGARVGNRVFWITSHGQNREGETRLIRRQILATDLKGSGESLELAPVGEPYRDLVADFGRAPQLHPFRLAEAAERAPEKHGALNIEGLCATPTGSLLIGFRNPIPEGRALLVPLLNPEAILRGTRAELGDPVLLDLGGLGIRDMALVGDRYYIIAGPFDGKGRPQLYEWAGKAAAPRLVKRLKLGNLHPEALVFWPEKGASEFLILSDDGSRTRNGKPCAELDDPGERCFRGLWVVRPGGDEVGDVSR